MRLMTQSQLVNVAIDCKKLQLRTSTIEESSFQKFLDRFLQPFKLKLIEKEISVVIQEYFTTTQNEVSEFEL